MAMCRRRTAATSGAEVFTVPVISRWLETLSQFSRGPADGSEQRRCKQLRRHGHTSDPIGSRYAVTGAARFIEYGEARAEQLRTVGTGGAKPRDEQLGPEPHAHLEPVHAPPHLDAPH